MYVETDFLLALIKDEDWLGGAAETVYREHEDELWTSQFTLVELLLVAYREDRDTERVVTNAAQLIEVRGGDARRRPRVHAVRRAQTRRVRRRYDRL
jgi:hypothetical protein